MKRSGARCVRRLYLLKILNHVNDQIIASMEDTIGIPEFPMLQVRLFLELLVTKSLIEAISPQVSNWIYCQKYFFISLLNYNLFQFAYQK